MSSHDAFDLEAMKQAVRYRAHIVSQIRDTGIGEGSVVDLGAGRGDYALALREETGKAPICIEIDPPSIDALKNEGLVVQADAASLPSLDGLYSINVLEHLENPTQFLSPFADRLKPGAKVFIYVPAMPSLFSQWDVRVGHFHRFTRRSISTVVESSGLQVVRSGYTDPLGGFIAGVIKLIGGGSKPLSPASIRLYDRIGYPISRIMEPVFRYLFGKNVWVLAEKPV